jgi:uncharacterized protein YndB with AHSA1/START domain
MDIAYAATRSTVRVMRKYAAEPARVFDAWLDTAKASKFLFATPNGRMMKVKIDPRVGGKFLFVDRRDGTDVRHEGEYLEIERPHRLAFRFSVRRYATENTIVRIQVCPLDLGSVVTLTHVGVLEDDIARTEHGWTTILNGLAETLMP